MGEGLREVAQQVAGLGIELRRQLVPAPGTLTPSIEGVRVGAAARVLFAVSEDLETPPAVTAVSSAGSLSLTEVEAARWRR